MIFNYKSKKTLAIETLQRQLSETIEKQEKLQSDNQKLSSQINTKPKENIRSYFEAASVDRFTNDVFKIITSPTQEKASELKQVRATSRALVRKSGIITNYIRLLQTNVLGDSGFTFQGRISNSKKGLHSSLNTTIESNWSDFTKRGTFEVSGRYSFTNFIKLIISTLAIDGEVLIQKIKGKGKYGIQYKLIDIDCLYGQGRQNSITGNMVLNGVEIDKFNKVVAYNIIVDGLPADGFCKWERIPADQIIHLVENATRINDTRGLPWISPIIFSLSQLDGYAEAELIAARLQAMVAMVITTRGDSDESGYSEKFTASQNFPTDIEPGMTFGLDPGQDAKMLASTHPNTAYESFCKFKLKEIASGLGITYNSLLGDYESTSFSSCKAAFLSERRFYKCIQNMIIEEVLDVFYEDFITCGTLNNSIKAPLMGASYDYLKEHQFFASGFSSVDDLKDSQSDALKLDMGIVTRSELLAERGQDLEELLRTKQKEKLLYEQYGFQYNETSVPITAPTAKTLVKDFAINENEVPVDVTKPGNE